MQRDAEVPIVPVNFSVPTKVHLALKTAELFGLRIEGLSDALRNNLRSGVYPPGLSWAITDGVLRFEIKNVSTELSTSLSKREQRIWKVIRQGVRGAQYLRELHADGLRPPNRWVKRGCPGTYLGIANDPKWRQSAQDEKSKIRRKAEALD